MFGTAFIFSIVSVQYRYSQCEKRLSLMRIERVGLEVTYSEGGWFDCRPALSYPEVSEDFFGPCRQMLQ
jgi:hypothetical protein